MLPLLGDVASLRLCTQGVPETTFRTLFVFFNFARNSISQVLRCVQGENETPRPSCVLLFPFAFLLRDRNLVDSKSRRAQAEPGDIAKDIGRYQWDGGITRHAIGEINRYHRCCCGRSVCALKKLSRPTVSLHLPDIWNLEIETFYPKKKITRELKVNLIRV